MSKSKKVKSLKFNFMYERVFYLFVILFIVSVSLFFINSKNVEVNKLYGQLNQTNNSLVDLKSKYSTATNQINYMEKTISSKNKEISNLNNDYSSYKTETDELLSSALLPPYISVDDQIIYTIFKLSNGGLLEWQIPFNTLENDLRKGFFKREYVDNNLVPVHASYYDYIFNLYTDMANNQINLCNTYQNYVNYYDGWDVGCSGLYNNLENDRDDLVDYFKDSLDEIKSDGKEYLSLENGNRDIRVMDFRPYIDDYVFSNVISDLYNQYDSDEEFIYELWYMVAQLTTYSSDIEETPKYPLETLLSGGGDCEDTSILMASLLKAVPRNWEIELVYIDSNNPENPRTVNHVIVYVDTGFEKYFIETTSKTEMNPYDEVEGWYFEI